MKLVNAIDRHLSAKNEIPMILGSKWKSISKLEKGVIEIDYLEIVKLQVKDDEVRKVQT